MTDLEEYERKIKEVKKRRQELVDLRAEKIAELNSAKEDLKELKEKADKHSVNLENLPELIQKKKVKLSEKIDSYRSSLEEVKEELERFDT